MPQGAQRSESTRPPAPSGPLALHQQIKSQPNEYPSRTAVLPRPTAVLPQPSPPHHTRRWHGVGQISGNTAAPSPLREFKALNWAWYLLGPLLPAPLHPLGCAHWGPPLYRCSASSLPHRQTLPIRFACQLSPHTSVRIHSHFMWLPEEHLTDGHPAVSQKDFTEKHWLKSAQQTRVFRVSGTVWGVQWWGQLVGGAEKGGHRGTKTSNILFLPSRKLWRITRCCKSPGPFVTKRTTGWHTVRHLLCGLLLAWMSTQRGPLWPCHHIPLSMLHYPFGQESQPSSQAHVLKEIKTNSNQTVGRGGAVIKRGRQPIVPNAPHKGHRCQTSAHSDTSWQLWKAGKLFFELINKAMTKYGKLVKFLVRLSNNFPFSSFFHDLPWKSILKSWNSSKLRGVINNTESTFFPGYSLSTKGCALWGK